MIGELMKASTAVSFFLCQSVRVGAWGIGGEVRTK
jgi:hypothetical protein